MIKDTDEQHGKKYTAGGPEVSEGRSFCPQGTGVCHPPSTRMWAPTKKLIKSCFSRVFIEFNLQPPVALISFHLDFLVTSSIPRLSRGLISILSSILKRGSL